MYFIHISHPDFKSEVKKVSFPDKGKNYFLT